MSKPVIRKSKKKMICSNHVIEVYEFEKPVITGFKGKGKGGRPKESERVKAPKKEIRRKTVTKARNTFKRLVVANFGEKSKFITLTYKDGVLKDITNIKESNKYFKLFIQRLQYKYGNFKYIAVVQFQDENGRGAVHYHMICDLPYVPHEDLLKIWRGGAVHIADVPYIGKRLINYMTKSFEDPRLQGHRAYLPSKNLEKPIVLYGEEAERVSEHYALPQRKAVFANIYKSDYNGKIVYKEYNLRYPK